MVILGVSKDTVASHKKFAQKHNLRFTIFSDVEKKVIKKYKAWGEKKFLGRTYEGTLRKTYLIDKEGNIQTQGKITASEVETNKLTISNTQIASSSATLAASIGTGTLPANTIKITIPSTLVTLSSKIFITPTTSTDKVLSVTNIIAGESFDVSLVSPGPDEIKFNWWIVQTE